MDSKYIEGQFHRVNHVDSLKGFWGLTIIDDGNWYWCAGDRNWLIGKDGRWYLPHACIDPRVLNYDYIYEKIKDIADEDVVEYLLVKVLTDTNNTFRKFG